MNIIIDKDLCLNCGVCVEICHDIFEETGDDEVNLVDNYERILENPDVQTMAELASYGCPVEAIEIIK